MKLFKLTAFLLSASLLFFSCKKTEDLEWENIYVGKTTMSGSQETPAVTTSGTGTVEATYNRLTKTLNYKVTFSGLTGAAAAAHIHGPGEGGIAAGVLQAFVGFPAAAAGTYSGSLYVDGVKIQENELLNHRYYVNIHTAMFPGGEIRGQIILSQGTKP
jgi:hypothetical protein